MIEKDVVPPTEKKVEIYAGMDCGREESSQTRVSSIESILVCWPLITPLRRQTPKEFEHVVRLQVKTRLHTVYPSLVSAFVE